MQNAPNDSGLERILGIVLLVGVTIGSLALALGLVASFIPGVPALSGQSAFLLRAGLVVLMATPIARVVASAIVYMVERDWIFVALTSAVLLELGAAVVAALHGK